MKETTKHTTHETTKPRGIKQRVKKYLGGAAMQEHEQEVPRPPVGEYNPANSGSVLDYAERNAAIAGIDKDPDHYRSLLERFRELDRTYNPFIQFTHNPNSHEYGFSEKHPKGVFKWNLSETSLRVSEDLLYVLGAVPDAEPEQIVYDNGIEKLRQEYVSSTGLRFIDVRTMIKNDVHPSDLHSLSVYLPVKE